MVDQFLIASEFKIGFAWMGLYFFVVYIFYNVIYYYEHNGEDRLSFEVFDWDPEPGKACLWVFLILAFFVPGFTAFHVFIYRYVRALVCVLCVCVSCLAVVVVHAVFCFCFFGVGHSLAFSFSIHQCGVRNEKSTCIHLLLRESAHT